MQFCGVMQYDGDLKLPKNFLVPPPLIDRVSGQYLAARGVRTFVVSETQKFGHVTFFWNGNRSGYVNAESETYLEARVTTAVAAASAAVAVARRAWWHALLLKAPIDRIEHARVAVPARVAAGRTGLAKPLAPPFFTLSLVLAAATRAVT